MPKTETSARSRSLKNLIASLIVDVDVAEGASVYVIKAPVAGTDRAKEIKSNLTMYGVEMTEGVGITTDKDLAEKIVAEFPVYTFEELR